MDAEADIMRLARAFGVAVPDVERFGQTLNRLTSFPPEWAWRPAWASDQALWAAAVREVAEACGEKLDAPPAPFWCRECGTTLHAEGSLLCPGRQVPPPPLPGETWR